MSIKAASKGNHFTLGAVDFHWSRSVVRENGAAFWIFMTYLV